MSTDTSEKGLETIIVDYLRDINGYQQGVSADYNTTYGLDTARLEAFLNATQHRTVEHSGIFATPAKKRQFFERVRDKITKRGVIEVLNKGVDHGINHFDLYYPLPDKVNAEAQRQYEANRFTVIRQLHFSGKTPKESVDIAIFINGLPIITMELKNKLTKQDTAQAVFQYQHDRDPKELLFAPKRCAVHFAADDQEIMMCTELKGPKSWFLPFNKGLKDPSDPLGRQDGAGNPVNPNGLNNSLRRTLNFIYRAELSRDEEKRDRFRTLVTQYEAFLRKLYYLREGHEFVGESPCSGFVDIVRQFDTLRGLYRNPDDRYANFKQYYEMLYEWRNADSHAAPVLAEAQLPAAIHIIVAMYVFATMVSVTDIEEALFEESKSKHTESRLDMTTMIFIQ